MLPSRLALLLALAAAEVARVSANGIPVCAPGTQTCGMSGCFTPMFAMCKDGVCFPRLLGMVSASPVPCLPYINSCASGAHFCSTGTMCVGNMCTPVAAAAAPPAPLLTPLLQGMANMVTNMSQALLNIRINGTGANHTTRAAAQASAKQNYLQSTSGAAAAQVPTAVVGVLLLLALFF